MHGRSRRAWKHFFYSNIFLGLVIGALVLVAISLGRVYFQNRQVENEIAHLQSEAKRLEAKRLETLDTLRYVDSAAFVEERARTQFNLVRPGESVAVLSGTLATSAVSQVEQKIEPPRSNPSKWFRVFFKKS
jgi:cell division protein FtsB